MWSLPPAVIPEHSLSYGTFYHSNNHQANLFSFYVNISGIRSLLIASSGVTLGRPLTKSLHMD